MIYEKDLKKIKIVCFDLAQYQPEAQFLRCNVWVNYQEDTIMSPDIIIATLKLKWKLGKWKISKKDPEILRKGITEILYYLNNKENFNFFDEF